MPYRLAAAEKLLSYIAAELVLAETYLMDKDAAKAAEIISRVRARVDKEIE
jgi:hypothetical protein